MKKLSVITGIFLIPGFIMMNLVPASAGEMRKSSVGDPALYDTTYRTMHGMKIKKVGDDSLIIYMKKKHYDHFEKHGCPWDRKDGKYYGHWSGFDLGIGGYSIRVSDMNFPGRHGLYESQHRPFH